MFSCRNNFTEGLKNHRTKVDCKRDDPTVTKRLKKRGKKARSLILLPFYLLTVHEISIRVDIKKWANLQKEEDIHCLPDIS